MLHKKNINIKKNACQIPINTFSQTFAQSSSQATACTNINRISKNYIILVFLFQTFFFPTMTSNIYLSFVNNSVLIYACNISPWKSIYYSCKNKGVNTTHRRETYLLLQNSISCQAQIQPTILTFVSRFLSNINWRCPWVQF